MSPSRSGRGTVTSSSPRRDHVSPIRILPVTFFDRHREMVDGIAKNSCDRIIIESFTADANQVKLMLSQKFCVVEGLRLSESGHATKESQENADGSLVRHRHLHVPGYSFPANLTPDVRYRPLIAVSRRTRRVP